MKEYHELICRLCLGQEAILSIFGDNTTIFSMIEMCCSLSITSNDGLPDKICNNCKGTLESFVLFRKTCHESDFILKQTTIKEESNEKISDDDENYDFIHNLTHKEETEQDVSDDSDSKELLNSLISISNKNNIKKVRKTRKKSVKEKLSKSDRNKRVRKTKTKENTETIDILPDFTIQRAHLLIKEETVEDDLVESVKPSVKLKLCRKRAVNESKAICPFCGKVYSAKKFGAHLKIHNVSSVSFTCDYCKKSFPTKGKIKTHIETHTQRRLSCYICGKMIKKYSLSKHIRFVHYKEMVTCTVCGKSLLQKSLRYHMKAHRGEKEFECKLCSYKCYSSTMLQIHIKTHSKEKPFKCTFCDSHFGTPRYKMIHERLHTGETPYQCPCCDKAYAQLCNMKSHFKHNHKEENYDKMYKGVRRPQISNV